MYSPNFQLSLLQKQYIQRLVTSRRTMMTSWRVILAMAIANSIPVEPTDNIDGLVIGVVRPQINRIVGSLIEIVPFELDGIVSLTESFYRARHNVAFGHLHQVGVGEDPVPAMFGITRAVSHATLHALDPANEEDLLLINNDIVNLRELVKIINGQCQQGE